MGRQLDRVQSELEQMGCKLPAQMLASLVDELFHDENIIDILAYPSRKSAGDMVTEACFSTSKRILDISEYISNSFWYGERSNIYVRYMYWSDVVSISTPISWDLNADRVYSILIDGKTGTSELRSFQVKKEDQNKFALLNDFVRR